MEILCSKKIIINIYLFRFPLVLSFASTTHKIQDGGNDHDERLDPAGLGKLLLPSLMKQEVMREVTRVETIRNTMPWVTKNPSFSRFMEVTPTNTTKSKKKKFCCMS